MSGLLIDERVVVIQPSLVRILGNMAAAAVLQQLHYWMPRATAEHDGHRWVWKTYDEWADEIGITPKQARTAIVQLEAVGLVLSCKPEAKNWRHRKWYRIDYAHPLLEPRDRDEYRSAPQGEPMRPEGNPDLPVRADRTAREGESNKTESTSETTTETLLRRTSSTPDTNPGTSLALLEPELVDERLAEPTRLANLLADLVEANGSRRPKVTASWVKTIDRMVRLDERTPEQIENAIRWCQRDTFWRANVLSPDTLRRQYDRLRLAAVREQQSSGPRGLSGVREFLATLDTP